jgi:hypothetical protein
MKPVSSDKYDPNGQSVVSVYPGRLSHNGLGIAEGREIKALQLG